MPRYTTHWLPVEGADLTVLRAQHQRAFPGNELAIVNGLVKVSVPEGETLATNIQPVAGPAEMSGNAPVNGG